MIVARMKYSSSRMNSQAVQQQKWNDEEGKGASEYPEKRYALRVESTRYSNSSSGASRRVQ
jgi:hypothetical protein